MTAGERLAVDTELPWVGRLLTRALGGPVKSVREPTVWLRVQKKTTPFRCWGMRPVTRGADSNGRRTLITNAGGSGFDLLVDLDDERLTVTARYRPPMRTRAANLALRSRFALLAGQVLVHYPVLWRAGWRGRVPLHAGVVRTPAGTPLIAGPGGVGKTRVLVGLLAAGQTEVTADNLCCADVSCCFGLAEPLRTDLGSGRATSHGRVERPLDGRVPALIPDRVVVLERGPRTEVSAIKPDEAARALVAGTYAAGELRRYWAFAATLALATGMGPAHPPVAEIAAEYADRLPCLRVRVGDGAAVPATLLCGGAG